ncbi:MAG TPA: tetratricopeptide repeat protein [Phycisphaerae bacterium]|nr:tetratricopeptide repeat protein [Phycisphaerae bacterium]
MTTAADTDAHAPLEAGASAPAARRAPAAGANPWRRLWQIPLLLAGLTLFAYGVRTLARTIKPVPFEAHVTDIQNMLAAGRYNDAVARINILADHFHERSQQATLEVLAGDTLYLAQQKQAAPVRSNFEGIIRHYQRATTLGFAPTPTFNERWGEASLALGDAPTAIQKFEAAAAVNPAILQAHVHELVDAYTGAGNMAKAAAVVDRLLAQPDLPIDDRAWGLCEKIRMALQQDVSGGAPSGELTAAVNAAEAAVPKIAERDPAGRVLVWIGRARYEQGQLDAAAAALTDARSRFIVHHLDDGRAELLLAKIAQAEFAKTGDAAQLKTAQDLFQEVVTRHAGTPIFAAALLGRAEVAAAQPGKVTVDKERLEADYRFAIKAVTPAADAAPSATLDPPAEFITHESVRSSLIAAHEHAFLAGRLDDALMYLSLARELGDPESADDALRWAITHERRADEMLAGIPEGHERAPALAMLGQAAEDYLRHSRLTTMQDDVSGNSLWKAAALFDAAGQTLRSAGIYEEFTAQRPADPRVPEALLDTGRLYQSVGQIDKAIPVYQRNIRENPRTPAAYTSAVNLARCYMTLGPQDFDKAEAALLSLVQDNRDLLPTANEFRISIFTLGELYYRNQRWADAILRLEEARTRYPDDPAVPHATFMLAESYRHSAQEIGAALKNNPGADDRAAMEAARSDRYARASDLFGSVISALDSAPEQPAAATTATTGPAASTSHLSPVDAEYLRTAYLDRASCAYETQRYTDAIHLYDGVASRFPDELIAVDAYIQIVNTYLALQQPAEAAAAAERARWVLKRIPDDAFPKTPIALTRAYYENFLKIGSQP